MGKLIEVVHVSLGGEVGNNSWAFPYLDDQHHQYSERLLREADALLLGRLSYEALSTAYTKMADHAPPGVPNEFVERMNQIPKFVASRTLTSAGWNATCIEGDVATSVAELKRRSEKNLLKYGNGSLDVTLMQHGLIDEFHLLLTPVAVGRGQHLFESIESAPQLDLLNVNRFESGVIALVYAPK
jgi:dihydrofolate reductase